MARKKTIEELFDTRMRAVRERHRVKTQVAPTNIIERLRQSVKQKGNLPRLPRI